MPGVARAPLQPAPAASGRAAVAPGQPVAGAPADGRGAGGGGGRSQAPPDPNRMYGVRIFDISDPLKPRQVAGVQTCRGSHTHTLAVDPKDKDNIYIYVSGHAVGGPVAGKREVGLRRGRERARHLDLRHRRDQGAARAPGTGGRGEPRLYLHGRQHRSARQPLRSAPGHAGQNPPGRTRNKRLPRCDELPIRCASSAAPVPAQRPAARHPRRDASEAAR